MFVPEPGYHVAIGDKRWEVREVSVDKISAEDEHKSIGLGAGAVDEPAKPTMTLKLRQVVDP